MLKWIRPRQPTESAAPDDRALSYKKTKAALERFVGQRVRTDVEDIASGEFVASIGIGYLEEPSVESRSRQGSRYTCFLISEVRNPTPARYGLWHYLRIYNGYGFKGWADETSVSWVFSGVRVTVTIFAD